MLYNGDTDSIVPYNGTVETLKKLNLKVIRDW